MCMPYIDEKSIILSLKELVDKYIENKDFEHKFVSEFSNNHDVEASILSKIIFLSLLATDTSKISGIFTSTVLIDGIKVSFDIMNNEKASKKDFYRLGSIANRKDANNLRKWEELKYTIGNFAPIPNANRQTRRHLQFVHNNKNERWDFLLQYCKEHWEDYSCDLYPSFEDYIIKTVQHVYVKEVFEDLKSRLRDRSVEDVEPDEFVNWMKSWNSILQDENKTYELISFGEKTTDMENIEEVIEMICLLIKARSRMIIALLQRKRDDHV